MIRYLLEILVIQCIFLLTYDLFLRRETFFQWNRVYILLVFPFSFVIPLIRIDVLTTKIPEENVFFPNFVDLEPVAIAPGATTSFWERLSMYEWIYLLGVILMALWFVVKLYRIFNLKQKGSVTYYPHFKKVILPESYLVFSFLKMVFVGDKIAKDKESEILIHELVHVRHWHSLDLLFFELMRIFFWFNPLVFLYQDRISELHEFIADALAIKTTKRAHYSALLAETFQTDKTSFVNPFYKRSLLQKRIAMLTKEKSRGILKLKYLAVLPLLLGILTYTSCEVTNTSEVETVAIKAGLETTVPFGVIDKVPIFPGCEGVVDQKACFQESVKEHIRKHFNYPKEAKDLGIEGRVAVLFTIDRTGAIINIRKRGPHELLENEVERIIKQLPKMDPGQHKGKPVAVPFSIPVTFKITDNLPRTKQKAAVNDELQVSGVLSTKNGRSYFTGKVTDHASMGVPGVTISIVGKETGVLSDFEGNLAISAVRGDVVKFEYIGLPTTYVEVE
ncbi:MAG: TonB family protein [Bacteroidota bacterium]